jgi:hypothetical protein
MSVNKYNASTGELTNIASGQRTWVGTQAAYKAAKQAGTLPNNAIIAITDDEVDHNHYSTDEVETGMYWIDGKPIYRKVLTITGSALKTDFSAMQLITGVDTLVKGDAMIGRSDGVWAVPYDGGANDYAISAILKSSAGRVDGYCKGGWVSPSLSVSAYRAIIEYTKTSD